MLRWFAGGIAALGFVLSGIAHAATPPPPGPIATICDSCSASLAVTSSSARVVLPVSVATQPSMFALTILNTGSKDAFFKLGDVTVTALTTNTRAPAGRAVVVYVNSATYIAAITSGADTTTLQIWQANGPVQLGSLNFTGSAPPSGAAGGDLAGTYPNPTIASLPAISGAALTALNASNLASGVVGSARGGAGTITGALKGNGAGVVSQAACSDLSNGATGCSTVVGTAAVANTGTSGHTVGFLDGANTQSGDFSVTGLLGLAYAGTAPTCGSGCASVTGNDQKITAVTGTAQVAVTVNFGHTWSAAPTCVANSDSLLAFVDIASVSTSAVTFGASAALTGAKIYAHCF